MVVMANHTPGQFPIDVEYVVAIQLPVSSIRAVMTTNATHVLEKNSVDGAKRPTIACFVPERALVPLAPS